MEWKFPGKMLRNTRYKMLQSILEYISITGGFVEIAIFAEGLLEIPTTVAMKKKWRK